MFKKARVFDKSSCLIVAGKAKIDILNYSLNHNFGNSLMYVFHIVFYSILEVFGSSRLRSNPIAAPHIVDTIGFDVIAHVPDAHPTIL